MSRCKDKVDYIVTDSPLLLSALYNSEPVLGELFNDVVNNDFQSYNNLNFLLLRVKPYDLSGRLQTEKESNDLVKPLKEILKHYHINYLLYNGDKQGYDEIIKYILMHEGDKNDRC